MSTSTSLRRWVARLTLGLLVLALAPSAFSQAVVGPSLQDELAALNPFETTTVIVTFSQSRAVTPRQVRLIEGVGVTQGLTLQALPMAVVLATPGQVAQLAALPGVVSVWGNDPLEYFNGDSRDITGVNRLRTDADLRNGNGVPYSGQGVTVLVHDSGIDATHNDLQFGSRVVQNTQTLDPESLVSALGINEVRYLEGVPNTDLGSGHGTHVAGTVGGNGQQSGGLYAGVAPGADLAGFGSGAAIAILDGLGGFDYALARQNAFENPIRIITNSWGSTADFDPADPIVQATYHAFRADILTLFAAGNSGSGADTHNPYAIAPWIISVGAGTKDGLLIDFSSRGVRGEETTFTTFDDRVWTASNEITVTAPGVDVISARAVTNGSSNGGDRDAEFIAPAHLPFYTMISGTSMATPHVAGIAALMMEANPTLRPMQIKNLLRATATNMPGRESWEAGAGYVNAYAAVQAALGLSAHPFGRTVNADRTFRASALVEDLPGTPFSIAFTPVGDNEVVPFAVPEGISRVTARARVGTNTVALVITDPDGNRYGSSISLPVLGETIAASGPGVPGEWTLHVSGIGSISGNSVDPLGITNGTAVPGQIDGEILFQRTLGFDGMPDVDGHEAQSAIEFGVSRRLVDARNGVYAPDARLRRIELAEYLVMGAGARQSAPLTTGSFSDVNRRYAPFAEAVTARGAGLRGPQTQDGLMRTEGAQFDPNGRVYPVDVAYAFVQALGLQEAVEDYTGDLFANAFGQRVPVIDQDDVPANMRGYVQAALDLGVLLVDYRVVQRPFDPEPTLQARVLPNRIVRRADYAVMVGRFFDAYFNGFVLPTEEAPSAPSQMAAAPAPSAADGEFTFSFSQNYPNPVQTSTRFAFSLAEATPVSLVLYDVRGREVARLVDEPREAGAYTVTWSAGELASGVYLARLEAGTFSETRRLVVVD